MFIRLKRKSENGKSENGRCSLRSEYRENEKAKTKKRKQEFLFSLIVRLTHLRFRSNDRADEPAG